MFSVFFFSKKDAFVNRRKLEKCKAEKSAIQVGERISASN